MPLETAERIADLIAANPVPSDDRNEGDDHIRMLKTVLRNLIVGVPGIAAPQVAQIVNGEITLTSSIVFLNSEVVGTGDVINKINTAGSFLGNVVILRPNSSSEAITVQHLASGAGRIILDGQVSHVMTNVDHFIILFRDSSDRWRELLRKPDRSFLSVTNEFTKLLTLTAASNDVDVLRFKNSLGNFCGAFRVDGTGKGKFQVDDENDNAKAAMWAGNDGAFYIGGNEVTGKRVSPILTFGPFSLTGATVDIPASGIPAGAREIIIACKEASLDVANGDMLLQLGTSGGIDSAGYTSVGGSLSTSATGIQAVTSGFRIRLSGDARDFMGNIILTHINDNTWVQSHSGASTSDHLVIGGGWKTLTGALTRLRLAATDGDVYDRGQVFVTVKF